MTVTRLRFAKTETRDFADRHQVSTAYNDDIGWNMSNRSFFTAFVVIAAVLAVVALVVR